MRQGRDKGRRRRRGRFLALEGLDGAGTTTQAERLAAWMRQLGLRVCVTAEPSGGPVGALVRQILRGRVSGAARGEGFDPAALALLFAADRLDHLSAEIEPHLTDGCVVISDRFILSSLAYQAITCGDAGWVEAVNSRALVPDATLFLEVRPRTAIRRRFAAPGSREIFEVAGFQRMVARSYQVGLARLRALGQRVEVVDGERTIEEVTLALAERVRDLL
ncbi:MAG TPA: dTMP kinase [Anaeromyxobacteraceae bacterium]|nr:dTMP kinase [Anaeromyxobacteraceae bacterium]